MYKLRILLPGLLAALSACSLDSEQMQSPEITQVELGQMLFFDPNLSKNRSQACSTCHDPTKGFVDLRLTPGEKVVSLGDDGHSLGLRNTPTASYAAFSPDFHQNSKGVYVGGQFLDGRAKTLSEQAKGPPLNPIEMGMPDDTSVVERIKENPIYARAFPALYGKSVLNDADKAYTAMAESIAAFEQTDFFAPFDSKYDRTLRGEEKLTDQEELGRTLFFSQQFTNCNICHQLQQVPGAENETFSNYEFHNIGVPSNPFVQSLSSKGSAYVDKGLLEHPNIDDANQAGKFKTPTLRNVAVTGPYMHNGVFKDLRTVILFYNKYNSKSSKRQINPETGEKWAAPEVAENISMEELETGPALDNKRVNALVAFLKTLTDKRYEHLLE